MRPIKPNTRRRSLWRTVLLAIGAIVIGGAGTVAALAGLKVIDLAKLAFWRSQAGHPGGLDWHSLSARSIPAYTTVTRDYLFNAKTGDLVLKWVPPDAVPKGIITDLSKILGRVTAREKPAVHYFFESDFLPVGTRPGIVGGTPLGKRAITLDAGKLEGCVYRAERRRPRGLDGQRPRGYAGGGPFQFRTDRDQRRGDAGYASCCQREVLSKPLVQDGVVVSPVTARITCR